MQYEELINFFKTILMINIHVVNEAIEGALNQHQSHAGGISFKPCGPTLPQFPPNYMNQWFQINGSNDFLSDLLTPGNWVLPGYLFDKNLPNLPKFCYKKCMTYITPKCYKCLGSSAVEAFATFGGDEINIIGILYTTWKLLWEKGRRVLIWRWNSLVKPAPVYLQCVLMN